MNNLKGIGLAAENRIPTGIPFSFYNRNLSTEDKMEIEIKGYKVLIDDEDYEKVMSHSWRTNKRAGGMYFRSYTKGSHDTRSELHLHRFINGTRKGYLCDHINGNTLDNRKCNLRECTYTGNSRNRRIASNNTTGYTGVVLVKKSKKNPYRANIYVNCKIINLGCYPTAQEASKAYYEAAHKYFGDFVRNK